MKTKIILFIKVMVCIYIAMAFINWDLLWINKMQSFTTVERALFLTYVAVIQIAAYLIYSIKKS